MEDSDISNFRSFDGTIFIIPICYFTRAKDDVIAQQLSTVSETMTVKYETDVAKYISYTKRLQAIRKERVAKLAIGLDDDDNCDMLSDTSSLNSSRLTAATHSTVKSHRSSKNRRKHERKLLSLKEGNPYEDVALIDALYNMAVKAYDDQAAVRTQLKWCMDYDLDKIGVPLQQTFGKLLDTIAESLSTIWLPEMMVAGEPDVESTAINATAQRYALISEYLIGGIRTILDYLSLLFQLLLYSTEPHQRCRPYLQRIPWQFEVLQVK